MADPQHHAIDMADPDQPLEVGQQAGHGDHSGFSLLTALGFCFLSFNSGMAIYRSDGDTGAIAFVAFSYMDLVLLFVCLRSVEPSTRSKLKAAVWVLTASLAIMFSYKVAAVMPLAVAVVVWAMAGATVVGCYYAFFRRRWW
ncbi:hypothetical protein BDA96_04G100200 [Sorghum bicolor]|jgi:hypothetical protein|uniref:Uncharacterized protein n=1 Tax=Sorghum bicolor TaxID=4558 RepID=A0A921UIJ6_SORBI|nr:hypothetical protein BDA96_04G100200 [Sorghum bicolor]